MDGRKLTKPPTSPVPPVIYVAPDARVFKELAYEACSQLAEAYDKTYRNPEVVGGLASFLNFVASRTAKYLSQGKKELLSAKSQRPQLGSRRSEQ